MKKPSQSHRAPRAVIDEMERLAEISPLLSPTIGWPMFKRGETVQTRVSFKFATKVDERVDAPSEPWGGPESDPELRPEIQRAMKGILSESDKFLSEALEPEGWKLERAEQGHVHHHAALWTRNGKQVGIGSYLTRPLPSVIWTPGKDFPRSLQAVCYASEVTLGLAALEGAEKALQELSLALGKRLRRPPMKSRPAAAIRERVLAPEEVAWEMPDGLPTIHVYREADGGLPAQHEKLLDSLIGLVRVIEHPPIEPSRPRTGILSLGLMMPETGRTMGHCDQCARPQPGSIRLVSGALGAQEGMAWSEVVGRDDTATESSVSLLLASSRSWNMCGKAERHAIFLSLQARTWEA